MTIKEQLNPEDVETHMKLLKELLGSMGEGCWLETPVHMAYGSNVTFGKGVYTNFNLSIVDDWKVTVGNGVLFAPNESIATTCHPLHPVLRPRGEMYVRTVVIGDNVWIGTGAIICPGVTIGEGSTIGAGSVVACDIPPYVFAAGNTCRVIRELTDRDTEYYFRDMRADQVE